MYKIGARKKHVLEVVMEFITSIIIITHLPESLKKLNLIISLIKDRGDKDACIELKQHCDSIDGELFSSIREGLLNGITIDESKIKFSDIDVSLDLGLIEELKALIKHNRAISLGYYYDEKKKLRLNTNKCVSYLQKVLECVVENNKLLILNRKEGIYQELTDDLMGKILRYLMNEAMADSWKRQYERDILDGLIREVPTIDISNIDDSFIPVNNGVFNLNSEELIPYDDSMFFTRKSPVNFIKEADCPKFLEALREIVCSDERLLMCIQEIFGYTLINNTKGERAFYFIGVGSNGKSFIAEILANMVGVANVSNIPLSRFSEKFGTEGLIDKSVNIANENEIGNAISTENLKIFVSGDRTSIARKYKGDLNYKSTCKMIFLLNKLPDTLDNTHGYYRKILIVPFNRIFQQEEMDKNLKEKVLEELSGVLNWAIEGAKRLINNDYKFTECEAIEKVTKAYKEEQNPVESFLKDALIYEDGNSETKKEILDSYKLWIEGQNISSRGTESPQRFWKALSNSAKILLNKELEYKKVQGTLHLKNFRIDYSKLPTKRDKYTFI
ncbi:DNA primase family protein [Clostridium perfringens]|uniref:DNA primase family protein n=1 Tax=Clostridium perfringens TaxID=1502 RepID=UPI00096A95FE|nr:DNA primase family protein [Clostridium perfringens]MDK0737791.1 phage/plasmid primase, P4 family [Clostridium perfringens]MDK0918947.1 phage/plasmid primase, P4 family [Clostridium perfringens]